MPTFRKKQTPITVAIFGQSNETHIGVQTGEAISGVLSRTAYPQAYASQRKPGLNFPVNPSVLLGGGPHFKIFDDLWDQGYDTQLVNGAVGGMSMVGDAAGVTKARTNSTAYSQYRAPVGPGDGGYAGDYMVSGGKVFLCVVGQLAWATNNGLPADTSSSNDQDRENVTRIGSFATAATSTQFDSDVAAAVGTIITDGTIQWKCLSVTTTYKGLTYSASAVLIESQPGFDPFNLLRRAMREIKRYETSLAPMVVIQNAQADTGYGTTLYSSALQQVGKYFARRGCVIFVGLSIFNPSGATTTQYNNLSAGVTDAVAQMIAAAGTGYAAAQIQTGANLYQLMGSTGAMAAGGAYFAKDSGQDNIHVNAAGAIVMGSNMVTPLLSYLPDRRPLTI